MDVAFNLVALIRGQEAVTTPSRYVRLPVHQSKPMGAINTLIFIFYTEKGIHISDNYVLFLHDFLLKFHAVTSVFKIGYLYNNQVNFPVKTKKVNLQGKIKKFTERAILIKK